jgi:hypothetical protein
MTFRLTVAGGIRVASNPSLGMLVPQVLELTGRGHKVWLRKVGSSHSLMFVRDGEHVRTEYQAAGFGDGLSTDPPPWVGEAQRFLQSVQGGRP